MSSGSIRPAYHPPLANRLISAELDHSVRAARYSDHSLMVVEVEGE